MKNWIEKLYSDPEMLRMGHLQRAEDANLGLGWIYYGLARTIRPSSAVVIGSWRGFVPMVIAKGLQDNLEQGRLTFIDPSLADGFWAEQGAVERHFAAHGLHNVSHFRLTTEEYVTTDAYRELENVGLLFIDGFHDEAHARFDYEAFRDKLGASAITVFHDSVREFVTRVYGPEKSYVHDVYKFIDSLRADPQLQVLDLPFSSGITLVRQRTDPDHPDFFPLIRRADGYTNLDQ